MDALLDPFRDDIGRRAVLELALLALACGPLGVWVIVYRASYASESLSHGLLPGLVIAAVAGLPLVAGAAGGVLIAALAVAAAGRDPRVGTDTGVAVAVGTLLGAGLLTGAAADTPTRLTELLFGDLLGVDNTDLAVAAVLVAGVLGALALLHRRLVLAAFDTPRTGSAASLAVLVMVAVVTVAAVQALGNLLSVAIIVAPGVVGLLVASRLPLALAVAPAVAFVCGYAGLAASYGLEIAAGPAVALASVAAVPVAAALRR